MKRFSVIALAILAAAILPWLETMLSDPSDMARMF